MRRDFWLATPAREDDPTRADLRLAMTLLIEAVGGTAAADVRVARMDLGNELLYLTLVPIEYRADVHHYLAERTDLPMPLDGRALILTKDQALRVMDFAHSAKLPERATPLASLDAAPLAAQSTATRSDHQSRRRPSQLGQ